MHIMNISNRSEPLDSDGETLYPSAVQSSDGKIQSGLVIVRPSDAQIPPPIRNAVPIGASSKPVKKVAEKIDWCFLITLFLYGVIPALIYLVILGVFNIYVACSNRGVDTHDLSGAHANPQDVQTTDQMASIEQSQST